MQGTPYILGSCCERSGAPIKGRERRGLDGGAWPVGAGQASVCRVHGGAAAGAQGSACGWCAVAVGVADGGPAVGAHGVAMVGQGEPAGERGATGGHGGVRGTVERGPMVCARGGPGDEHGGGAVPGVARGASHELAVGARGAVPVLWGGGAIGVAGTGPGGLQQHGVAAVRCEPGGVAGTGGSVSCAAGGPFLERGQGGHLLAGEDAGKKKGGLALGGAERREAIDEGFLEDVESVVDAARGAHIPGAVIVEKINIGDALVKGKGFGPPFAGNVDGPGDDGQRRGLAECEGGEDTEGDVVVLQGQAGAKKSNCERAPRVRNRARTDLMEGAKPAGMRVLSTTCRRMGTGEPRFSGAICMEKDLQVHDGHGHLLDEDASDGLGVVGATHKVEDGPLLMGLDEDGLRCSRHVMMKVPREGQQALPALGVAWGRFPWGSGRWWREGPWHTCCGK